MPTTPTSMTGTSIAKSEDPPTLPCCRCQSCAEVCHADHDVVSYVGIGPCTCDCSYLQSDTTTTTDGNNNNLKKNCEDNISREEGEDDAVKICHCKLADHSSTEATKLGFTHTTGSECTPSIEDPSAALYGEDGVNKK